MRVQVKKWGNSASVRIPSAIMESLQLSLDQVVDIREESGRIVIEPINQPAYSLDDLLSQITDENMHAEVDFGFPVGKEVW